MAIVAAESRTPGDDSSKTTPRKQREPSFAGGPRVIANNFAPLCPYPTGYDAEAEDPPNVDALIAREKWLHKSFGMHAKGLLSYADICHTPNALLL